jgi:3-hydroxyisobutyrate dehydrogenase-like beta-hydroxyacid dehydrogenase
VKIAIVGLGNMGGRIARRLLGLGHELGVYDTNAAVVEQFSQAGATAYHDLAELGGAYPCVIMVLPNAGIVRQVALGERSLAAGMRPGSVLIDMTSSVPAVTREVGAALAQKGVHMLDAPVSGGVKKAENGSLSIMVGGEAEVLEEVTPLLKDVGESVIHVGVLGAGHTAKALNNLITATVLAITSEALALGVKMGVDAGRMLEVINAGSGRSAASETKFPQQVLSRRFEVGFTVELMSKDVGIALGMARDADFPAAVGSAVDALWKAGVAEGYGAMDHTAIALFVERMLGVEIK